MDSRINVVNSILEMPVVIGALYALDLDDTLFRTKTVFQKTPLQQGDTGFSFFGKPRYKKQITILHTEGIVEYVNSLSNVIYITSRSPDIKEFTTQQLHDFGFPPGKIFFSMDKGVTLLQETEGKNYSKIFFADDRDDNVMNVLRNCPGVSIYRISPELFKKLEYRKNKK